VTKIINDLTGTDPNLHRWTFDVRQRGAKVYRLLDSGDDGSDSAQNVATA
jgi:hypothetical protein